MPLSALNRSNGSLKNCRREQPPSNPRRGQGGNTRSSEVPRGDRYNEARSISHCGRITEIQDSLIERYVEQKEAIDEGNRRRAIALEFEIKELLCEKKKIKCWAAV